MVGPEAQGLYPRRVPRQQLHVRLAEPGRHQQVQAQLVRLREHRSNRAQARIAERRERKNPVPARQQCVVVRRVQRYGDISKRLPRSEQL